jgi:hypothetical protein
MEQDANHTEERPYHGVSLKHNPRRYIPSMHLRGLPLEVISVPLPFPSDCAALDFLFEFSSGLALMTVRQIVLHSGVHNCLFW